MSRPIVIVTRAQPGCAETAVGLAALSYRPIQSPVLVLASVSPPPDLPLSGLQGLVFTSANGVRAYAEQADMRDLKAWCVGPATVAAAERAGFQNAVSADGDASDLARMITAHADPREGALLHVANTAAAGALVQTLKSAGFVAHFAGLYSPNAATTLSEEAEETLRRGVVSAVLIHSAKGAEAFASLASGAVREGLEMAAAVSVSERAAAPVAHLPWRRRVTAHAPNETALLAALAQTIDPVS
ncbi:MAG: uroporphyrinogen-III synthase [Pseudomonadota bacterium]